MKLDEKLALNENLLKEARAGLLSFGAISVCYLIRKLKCTEQVAKEIIRQIGTA